jgi:hypothetical protein
MKEIQPIVEKIAYDFNYQEAIFNYANSSGEYFDVRRLDGSLQIELAEEVVADQIASMYGDLEVDYGIDSKIKEQFKSMIEQEEVADYLGENLGNQEFVNELVRSADRTQIQKIMDWIKNKITTLKNTITGNKELNYWNKIIDSKSRNKYTNPKQQTKYMSEKM